MERLLALGASLAGDFRRPDGRGWVLPELRARDGFAGGYLLIRELDGIVELTTHTFWESMAAIQAFAGENITRSVVEPEAQSALLDFDRAATHRTVLVDGQS